MNRKVLINKVIAVSLLLALNATYSMVVLANNGKAVGEIIIPGIYSTGEAPVVLVNGESVKSGRTIFSTSTISTPGESSVIVDLGKAGKIELLPKSSLALSFDDTTISAELTSGSVTVLNAAKSVSVKTLTGDLVNLNAGETATASSGTATKNAGKKGPGGLEWWGWALIIGGATAVIILATTGDGGVVSPTR